VDADLRIARIPPEVDLGDSAMLLEGGVELLEAAYFIRLAWKCGLQIELEGGAPTLCWPVSGRTHPLGRVVVMVTMAMIVIMVAVRTMLMVVVMTVCMPMIVVVIMLMVMLAVGAVHVLLHDEPLALLRRRARDKPHQLPELLRLRHVASS
jgi:hypothetical protein